MIDIDAPIATPSYCFPAMTETIEAISTGDLAVGMYIARLDRPWLETPFLFQGFTIKSAADIAELRRHCDYVYVHVTRSGGPDNRRAASEGKSSPRKRSFLSRLTALLKRPRFSDAPPQPGEFYPNTVDMKAEVPHAQAAYGNSSGVFVDMMEQVRSGGKIDIPSLQAAVSPLLDSLLRNKDAMTWLSRIKQADDYTYGHSVSCSIYAIAFGRHLGLPKQDLETLGLGGLLLDVGKTRIPKELLSKAAKLTPAEMSVMRAHAHHGQRILKDVLAIDPRVRSMVVSHHERYDGSGYPEGLKGPDIPVFARIAGIVDFYDALITPRVYAPAVSAFDAMRDLHRGADRLFQSEMVEQFIQAVGVFPNGALVELSTGEVAVVIEQNRVRRLRPKIVLILDSDKRRLAEPRIVDLQNLPAEIGENGAVWIDRGLQTGAYGIDPGEYYL